MTDYVKSTNFTSKDSLASGNPLKIVKGTEFDIEFNNIATAITSKANLTNPVFAGVPIAPTAVSGTATNQIATTAFVGTAISTNNNNISLLGIPTAPTASVNTNTTQLATTAFVVSQIADDAPTKTGVNASGNWDINITGNAATSSTTTSIPNGIVTKDKLEPPVAGTTYTIHRLQTATVLADSASYLDGGFHRFYSSAAHLGVTVLVPGVITCRVEHSITGTFGTGVSSIRILKNGVLVQEWSTSSTTFVARSVDVTVNVGDVIIFQQKATEAGQWRSLLISSSNPSMAVA